MTDRPFAVGDEVHWTSEVTQGRSTQWYVHDGTIRKIVDDEARVRTRSKRYYWVPLEALRHKGEPSYLDEMMQKRDEVPHV